MELIIETEAALLVYDVLVYILAAQDGTIYGLLGDLGDLGSIAENRKS